MNEGPDAPTAYPIEEECVTRGRDDLRGPEEVETRGTGAGGLLPVSARVSCSITPTEIHGDVVLGHLPVELLAIPTDMFSSPSLVPGEPAERFLDQ